MRSLSELIKSRSTEIAFLALMVTTLHSQSAQATVINVPGDQPTIQAGIDEAVDGDTVLVGPGIYPEALQCLLGFVAPDADKINGAAIGVVAAVELSAVADCSVTVGRLP